MQLPVQFKTPELMYPDRMAFKTILMHMKPSLTYEVTSTWKDDPLQQRTEVLCR
jgi:hypothetical protein